MFYFFMATAPTDIYTLSLHDALPILPDQKIGDDGTAEGGERRMDRIAGRNPEAGDEAATPAAGECPTEDQEKDWAWRRRDRKPDHESERQGSGHLRLACPAL